MPYNANPAPPIPIVQRSPTRIVPSGTLTLTSGASQVFIGSNQRQDRVQFIVTNLDTVNSLKIQTLNGVNFTTVFPLETKTIETSADFQIVNTNGVSISCEVCELYPDVGNLHGVPMASGAAAAGGGPGGSAGGGAPGGGSFSGGGRSGGSQTP